MKNATSIWMAVLTFTAVILAAILLSSHSQNAQAAMINAQADYSLITSGVNGGDEALFIVDKASQKMVAYQIRGTELIPLAGTSFR